MWVFLVCAVLYMWLLRCCSPLYGGCDRREIKGRVRGALVLAGLIGYVGSDF